MAPRQTLRILSTLFPTPYTLIGIADDTLPPAIPGPFGDPEITHWLAAGITYAIAVVEYPASPSVAGQDGIGGPSVMSVRQTDPSMFGMTGPSRVNRPVEGF